MTDITVLHTSSEDMSPTVKDTLSNLVKYSKNFNIEDYNHFAIVNTNNIDIGVICVSLSDQHVRVKLVQAPNVCRMSILSLIDSSIYYLQSIIKDNGISITFQDVSYAHTFKLQQIIKDITVSGDDYVTKSESLLYIDMSLISLKNIILEKI